MELICFFDEGRTPRIWILNITTTLVNLISLLLALTVQIPSCLSPSMYRLIFLLVSSRCFFYIPHRSLSLICPLLGLWSIFSLIPFLFALSLLLSLSLYPSLLCRHLSSVYLVISLPMSSHLPPVLFFCPVLLPCLPYPTLSLACSCLLPRLSLFSLSKMYYCHLVFEKWTTGTLSLIIGTDKPAPPPPHTNDNS